MLYIVAATSIAVISLRACMGRRRRTLLWIGVRRALRRRTPPPSTVPDDDDDEEEGCPDACKEE